VALAGAPASADNNIGCGLGTQLWEGNDDMIIQLFGATTNGFIGTQTFGISSNTLGCKRNQVITAEHRVNMFAGANIDGLARDMAVGGGESLETLAALMEVEDADRPALYALTKQNFAALFPSDDVTAGDVLANLDRLMAEDARLARYVRS
jgi:hypothetical protein